MVSTLRFFFQFYGPHYGDIIGVNKNMKFGLQGAIMIVEDALHSIQNSDYNMKHFIVSIAHNFSLI